MTYEFEEAWKKIAKCDNHVKWHKYQHVHVPFVWYEKVGIGSLNSQIVDWEDGQSAEKVEPNAE